MKSRYATCTAIATLCLVSVAARAIRADSPSLEASIRKRATDFAAAVNSHDPGKYRAFVAEDFGARMQRLPPRAHIAMLSSYWDMSHGLALRGIVPVSPDAARVNFLNHLTGGWSSIYLRVEAAAPHRVVSLQPISDLHGPLPAGLGVAVSSGHLSDSQISTEMAAYLHRLSDAQVFSGVVELARNGTPIFRGAFGQADRAEGVANRMDTEFNIGSMNKMFTAVAIAQLVERGKLTYDDPLAKFLPQFPNPDAAKKIEIKHLLSHTSGLPMWWKPLSQISPAGRAPSVDELLATVPPNEKLLFEPGTHYRYSNLGFLLLGKVIEEVSGVSYAEYVRQNVLLPAGMANTDTSRPPPGRRAAIGYLKTFDEQGKPVFLDNRESLPARGFGGPQGGGYSTADDLVRFAVALESGKLLKRESIQRLLSAKPELGAPRYGFGFDVDPQHDLAGHGGGSVGISDNLDIFLGPRWVAVVLSNYTENAFEVCEPVVLKLRGLVPIVAISRP